MLEMPEYDLRFDLGFGRAASTFQDNNVQQLIKGVCLHQLIYSNMAALDQLSEGLSSHRVKELLTGNFPLAKALFCHSPTSAIDVPGMRSLFRFTPSPEGSNARSQEEEIILHWYRFLSDVGEGLVSVGMDDSCC